MKLNGREWLLYYDDTTPLTTAINAVTTANAKLVGCLTSNGFEYNNETIDVTTKCSGNFGEFLPGASNSTMSGEGLFDFGANMAPELSNNELFALAKSRETGWWFLISDTEAASVPVICRYAQGFITSYSETGGDQEGVGFSLSVQCVGEVGDQTTLDTTP